MNLFTTNHTLYVVASGTIVLGALSGSLGCFIVLRKQSLLGDALSHSALPGIAVAFLLCGDAPLSVLIGAGLAAWLATLSISTIVRQTRIPYDSALAGTLAVFFGLGLVLLAAIRKSNIHNASQVGLERYLYGQAATLLVRDLRVIAMVGAAAICVLILFWKEFKLLIFNSDHARILGRPVAFFDFLLNGLMVVAVVIGLQCVGAVLMSALLVAPAVAARQWTNRLGTMVVLAGVFGSCSGCAGTFLGDFLSTPGKTVPTGPTIVLCAVALVVVSMAMQAGRQRLHRRRALEGQSL